MCLGCSTMIKLTHIRKRKENEARIKMKKTQSAKKSSRRGGGSYD